MNARMRTRRPPSAAAVRLLARVVDLQRNGGNGATLADLFPSGATPSALNTLHVLADRSLVTVDGSRIRPRQRGIEFLRTRYARHILST